MKPIMRGLGMNSFKACHVGFMCVASWLNEPCVRKGRVLQHSFLANAQICISYQQLQT